MSRVCALSIARASVLFLTSLAPTVSPGSSALAEDVCSRLLHAGTLSALIERVARAEDAEAFDILLAIGRSRHADALRFMVTYQGGGAETRGHETSLRRLGRSLALLALGDGSETSTISRVLLEGPVELRRKAAYALSRMNQMRPRMILASALGDLDPEVLLVTAPVLARRGSVRARRVLLDLLRTEVDEKRRVRAARALLKAGYVFPPDEMPLLPQPIRSQVRVAEAMRTPKSVHLKLRILARSDDAGTRAGALGVLVAARLETAVALRKLSAQPELAMALALLDEPGAFRDLTEMGKDGAIAATLVLRAFVAAGTLRAPLEPEHARRLAKVFETWLVEHRFEEPTGSHLLRAMQVLDPPSALDLARATLRAGQSSSLRTAIRVLGRGGDLRDVPELAFTAKRADAKTAALAWKAAGQVCAQ